MKVSIIIDENYEEEIFQDLEESLQHGEPVSLLIGKKRLELHFISLDKTMKKERMGLGGTGPLKWVVLGSFELKSGYR